MTANQQQAFANLRSLGFTPRQADFLYLVGTNTGVFTAEHFNLFCGVARGASQTRLLDRLEQHNFALRINLGRGQKNSRTQLFHIRHKAFYTAIMCSDSRLRRGMSYALIRQRIQFLDYIVTYAHNEFLGTEDDKVEYFSNQLSLPLSLLPSHRWRSKKTALSTLRYFPERFPIFTSATDTGHTTGIVYGEDPTAEFRAYRNFMTTNREFFAAIPALHIVYISPSSRRRELAQALLTSTFSDSRTVETSDLQRYFDLRKRLERANGEPLQREDYAFWSHARKLFATPQYEQMYKENSGQLSLPSVSSASPRRSVFVETFSPFTTLDDPS
jgi:hypothetical protein